MWRRLLIGFLCFGIAALPSQDSTAVDEVASNLICMCGCDNMIVSSCACGTADTIRAEIRNFLSAGLGPEQIWDRYVARYGTKVIATPPMKGFNLTVWVVPFLATFIVGGILVTLLRRWRAATVIGEAVAGPPKVKDDERLAQTMERELRQFRG